VLRGKSISICLPANIFDFDADGRIWQHGSLIGPACGRADIGLAFRESGSAGFGLSKELDVGRRRLGTRRQRSERHEQQREECRDKGKSSKLDNRACLYASMRLRRSPA
jgi:hypothetical protein